jgi:YesN/AraC family two-component response regulator
MSYLSRSYKKFRGINLLDYIHKIRIEKAKLIINSTNLKDVAQQVGYYESKALIRVFKKYEGVTPGRFKKINS